jgi:putative phosphoribosyl transferase
MNLADYPKWEVSISCDKVFIQGSLVIPRYSVGLIIFAHGSGSSRFSPRNNFVARFLNQCGFATLLLDLLLPSEDQDLKNRFNIQLLSARLLAAARWAKEAESTKGLPLGLFGASTGAAAALQSAGDAVTKEANDIFAVVSRGGRPDLADASALERVEAPTLLIVGQDDEPIITYNKIALQKLHCPKSMHLIRGATHLFEEPGALEIVAELALEWFKKNLRRSLVSKSY